MDFLLVYVPVPPSTRDYPVKVETVLPIIVNKIKKRMHCSA